MATSNPPGYAPPAFVQPQGNGIAVAGMICGIVGLVLFFLGVIGMIVALLGIIFGGIGLAKSKRVGRGKGAAMTGLICGLLGIVAGVLFYVVMISAFTSYMSKSKSSESQMQLRVMEEKVKSFHVRKQILPASATPMPTGSPCSEASAKYLRQPESAWRAAGWGEMGFHIDEDSYCSYSWTAEVPSGAGARGVGLATCDIDCDGTPEIFRLEIQKVEGNLQATYSDR